jgi:serine/threonine protein kinase
MTDPIAGSISVEALAEEFLVRKRKGERPTVAEYLARYSQLADEIRDVFPVLGLVEDFKPGSGDATGSFAGAKIPGLEKPVERLGDFRLLRVVGRGGMGVVYEAEQESLGRRVALKVMSGHRLSDPTQLVRFTREAKAAARLHHTNIVPVFGVGQEEGFHYYVMQFIQGQGLDAVLGELRRLEKHHEPPTVTRETRPGEISAAEVAKSLIAGTFSGLAAQTAHDSSLSKVSSVSHSSDALNTAVSCDSSLVLPGKPAYARSVARIGLHAAEGLAYAHEKRILHRDIKPSNLLLDAHGIVWITDFGLAKATTDSDLTHTGDIIGTVRYMAPERFHGHCDARSDVYALGLTLYELLAKRPAFDEADRGKLIRLVTDTEPAPLRKLDRMIPRDLATIVHKAIEREPSHRYRSAEALVEDLRRFLEDRPITARQVTSLEQLWRWCKRNPLAAALSASLLTTLVGGLLVVSVLLLRLWAVAGERGQLYWAERQRSEQLREASDRARDEANRANAETRTARALFDRLLLRDDVLAVLKARPHTDPEIQSACLKLAESWNESRWACNEAAWDVVSVPGRPTASYQRALRLAEVASRLKPDDGDILNTLGVAQYRLDLLPEALETLTHSNALNQGKAPGDLAFLAMAHQRLRHTVEARAMLDRLRELMRPGYPAIGNESLNRAFVAEAEVVVLYDPVFPADPFSR